MKLRPVGTELFHADRHDEAIVAFRNFAKAPTNRWQHGNWNHSPSDFGHRTEFTVKMKTRCLRTGLYSIVGGGD
jgi:hypothetical protein